MLDKIGVKKLDELYSDVPAEFLHKGAYALPPAMSEQEIRDCFASLEAMNAKLYAGGHSVPLLAFGVPDGLYPVPMRNFAGYAALYL